jgi:phage virion morphogenesis protein
LIVAGVTIRVDDAQIRAALAALASRLGNMQDVYDAIGSRLLNLARIGFTREQAPDGTAWKPLAPATILARQKSKHWPGPILRVTGELYRSLNYKAGPTSVEIGAGWGASAAYAAIQQFGGPAGRGHSVTIPARPYLPSTSILPDAWIASCLDVINTKLMAGVGNG